MRVHSHHMAHDVCFRVVLMFWWTFFCVHGNTRHFLTCGLHGSLFLSLLGIQGLTGSSSCASALRSHPLGLEFGPPNKDDVPTSLEMTDAALIGHTLPAWISTGPTRLPCYTLIDTRLVSSFRHTSALVLYILAASLFRRSSEMLNSTVGSLPALGSSPSAPPST